MPDPPEAPAVEEVGAASVPSLRSLLARPPDEYVAARTELAARARAAGDRALAARVRVLVRPSLALWAVLAAADDPALAAAAVEATTALAAVQASGADRTALGAATADRRRALDAVVAAAVAALATSAPVSEGRRDEIRAFADRLSRHPETLPAWCDGSLRAVPDDDLGFSAFVDLTPPDRPRAASDPVARPARHLRAVASTAPGARGADVAADADATDVAEAAAHEGAERERAERERAERERAEAEARRRLDEADAAVSRAAADLEEAERRCADAEEAERLAREAWETARQDRAAARDGRERAARRHADALAARRALAAD